MEEFEWTVFTLSVMVNFSGVFRPVENTPAFRVRLYLLLTNFCFFFFCLVVVKKVGCRVLDPGAKESFTLCVHVIWRTGSLSSLDRPAFQGPFYSQCFLRK